ELPDAEGLKTIYGASGKAIKELLLDQSLLCGIGNLYSDEILFRAGLHPKTRGKDLSPDDFAGLRDAIGQTLADALQAKEPGSPPFEVQAYGRTDELCGVCSTPIARLRLANRSAHFCPQCQPRRRSA
ncbi:MAG: DNA-formamidopyrimidine glycosylase, partial [Gemmatimonadetes bacterium]|nr:DNA-formamidopyrimidine glycosylase [Gemmatimonadota bacterium]